MLSADRKRELRRRFDTDRLRPVLRVVFDAALAVEIGIERVRDRFRRPTPPLPPGAVTAVVKTFQRPRQLRRLVRSIRRVQPDLPVLVVDDSRTPAPVPGAELLEMPFNSGVSAGRNAALERVRTPYFVLFDDDFYLTRRTLIAPALQRLMAHEAIDILGGVVVNLPDYSVHDYSQIEMRGHPASPEFAPGATVGGLPVQAKVPNFFLGRTDAVRSVGWAEELKVMEHQEFFWRAWGVLTTVFDANLRVFHARNPFDRSSPERSANFAEAAALLGFGDAPR